MNCKYKFTEKKLNSLKIIRYNESLSYVYWWFVVAPGDPEPLLGNYAADLINLYFISRRHNEAVENGTHDRDCAVNCPLNHDEFVVCLENTGFKILPPPSYFCMEGAIDWFYDLAGWFGGFKHGGRQNDGLHFL